MSHAITVNYQTLPPASESGVYYDTVSHHGVAGQYAFHVTGRPKVFSYIPDKRLLHRLTLRGLTPGTTYYFTVGDAQSGYSREFKFRALPDSSEGLRFIDGGDMGIKGTARTLLKLAAAYTPWFVIVGGDVSYASRKPRGAKVWDIWFKNWSDLMVTPQGYLVPLVTAIGNHEITKDARSPSYEDRSPFYWRFFGQQSPEPYFSRKLGNTVFFFLDAGNLVPYNGKQLDWLKTEMAKYQNVPIKFAVYHQGLYPAYRAFEGASAVAGRKYWLPVFDHYHLTVAFEHHDHVFKRSKLLKNNAINPNGTLYVGDGCFGQNPRTVDAKLRWYLAKASSTAHFWLVDVSKNRVRFRAVNTAGKVFDEYDVTAPSAGATHEPVAPGARTGRQSSRAAVTGPR